MANRKLKRIVSKKPVRKRDPSPLHNATWCDVRVDRDGALDELYVEKGISLHIEQMDERRWWLAIYKDEQRQVVWFESTAPIRVSTERDM